MRFGLKLPEIDKSLATDLACKWLRFGVLLKVEGPILLNGVTGLCSVHYKRTLPCDIVKHDLNNTSLVKNN